MNYVKNFSENVKKLLAENGLSIKKLSEELEIPASSLTDSLKSKKGVPISTSIQIADYFGYDVETLTKNNFEQLPKKKDKESISLPTLDAEAIINDLDLKKELINKIRTGTLKQSHMRILSIMIDTFIDEYSSKD